MPFNPNLLVLIALACAGAASPSAAQTVFKCGSGSAVKYSDRPCSGRIVNTADAPVPARPNPRQVDLRRLKENRILAQSLRRRPGETAPQFELRRRRAAMLASDRAECARLDTRIPVEQARMDNPDPHEVSSAAAALEQSRRRFRELRC
ncbi:MAG TPA: hypothetical protein VGE20_19345 [Ramlibacter sp.]